jgi:broad specificity phosphatase PhoE
MRKFDNEVVLLKHAYPILIESVPPKGWRLGDEGKKQAAALGEAFRGQNIQHILTSPEPKALETATQIGHQLSLNPRPVEGLHELDITPRPIMPRNELVVANKKLFETPDRSVLGTESANNACERFEDALRTALETIPHGENVLVVRSNTTGGAASHDQFNDCVNRTLAPLGLGKS